MLHNNYLKNIKYDLPAGLVVFLVAVPLCLGIALASGAPFMSGILAGIIGGTIVPLISRSQLSVSGPAAGLTAVVLAGIEEIGTFEGFLVAVFLAGIIQVVLGSVKAGYIAYFFPAAVIRGMLTAIGLILILKQFPHAVGYDVELFGLDKFIVSEEENTLTLFFHSLTHIEFGALIISLISLAILITWENTALKNFRWIPGALVVVVLSIFLNEVFRQFAPYLVLENSHRVSLPEPENLKGLLSGLHFPDWTLIGSKEVLVTAFTIGIIASVETLLTIEAVDKLDPWKRSTPLNRELIAQGVGNTIAGLIGAIPITSVIVRSSASINAGGRTKMAALFHGLFLLTAVALLAPVINRVPLASLAAILLMVGYKLARPALFRKMYENGKDQFIPFITTVIAILLTDLLVGISVGIVVGLIFVVRTNFHSPVSVTRDRNNILIRFTRDVSFLNKAIIRRVLDAIPDGTFVIIDGANARFIDHDVQELFQEFEQQASLRDLRIEFKNMKNVSFSSSPIDIF